MILEEELISMITYTDALGKAKKGKKTDVKVDTINVNEAKRRRMDDNTDGYN